MTPEQLALKNVGKQVCLRFARIQNKNEIDREEGEIGRLNWECIHMP